MEKNYKIPLTLLLMAIVGYLAKYTLNVFLARHLPHGLYGDFAIAIRVLGVIGTLMLLGSNMSAKRFLVKYLNEKKPKNTLVFIRWNIKLFLIMTLVSLTIVFMLITAMLLLHCFKIQALTEYHLAIYMLWLTPLIGGSALVTSYLLCNHNYILASTFSRAGRNTLLLGFFVAIVMLIDAKLNYITIIGTVCFVSIILAILKMLAFTNNYPKYLLKELGKDLHAGKKQKEKWWNCSINLALNTAIFTIITLTDLMIVEIVGHSEVMVDKYAAVITIANIILILTVATVKFVTPNISKLLAQHKKDKLQIMLDKFNLIQISVALITVITICVFGKELLLHFGQHYTTAILPLIILTVGYGVMALSRTAVSVLSVIGDEKILLYSATIALILLITFCSIATYFWGILGAASATAIVTTSRSIFLIIITRERSGLRTCLLF